ncbi:MAG: TraR/DksA family transcriptional regulator [Acidobacteriota bacterium]
MSSTQLGRLRFKLETRLKELWSSLRNRENVAVERTPDVLDDVELAWERDLAIWSLDKRFAQVRFVEAALDRIADGTYGCCLECDEEITMKRLTALPHASLCIACQERAEFGELRKSAVLKELTGTEISA